MQASKVASRPALKAWTASYSLAGVRNLIRSAKEVINEMDISDYQLWYKEGVEIHDLIHVQGIQSKGNTARFLIQQAKSEDESKRVAEKILDMVRFDADAYKLGRISNGKWSMDVEKLVSHEIDKVHRMCSEEIRSKWAKPIMTDEELADYFYRQEVEPRIADAMPDAMKAQTFDLLL